MAVRTTFSEEIKSKAMTIEQIVEDDFGLTDFCDEGPKFYSTHQDPHYDDTDFVLYDVELKDILDDRIPNWVYNEEYTEEEEALADELWDKLYSDFYETYIWEWDNKVQQFFDDEDRNAEEELGTDERYQKYLEDKKSYEARRDDYYGWCMNGGGGKKAFRRMYGDGKFQSYGEWLITNYGE